MASLFLFVFWQPLGQALGISGLSSTSLHSATPVMLTPTRASSEFCYRRPDTEYEHDAPLSDSFLIPCSEVVERGIDCPEKPVDSSLYCRSLSMTATARPVVPVLTRVGVGSSPTPVASRYPTFTPIFRP